MQAKGWIMLRVLLNRYHPEHPKQLLQSLNEEEIKAVTSQEIQANNPEITLIPPQEHIKNIHYSWLMPAIQKIPKDLLLPLLSALPEPLSTRLHQEFNLTKKLPKPPSPPVQTFLVNTLYTQVFHTEVLPIDFFAYFSAHATGKDE